MKNPNNFEKVRSVLLPKDYIRFLMTGEKAMEPSDAAGTLLFDIRKNCWSAGMLSALDLDEALLPPIAGSADVVGRLTSASAA